MNISAARSTGHALLGAIPTRFEAKLLFIGLLVAFGSLGGLPFELFAPLLVSHFLDRFPFLGSHAALLAPLLDGLLFGRGLPFALTLRHASTDKLGLIALEDVVLTGAVETFLAVLAP